MLNETFLWFSNTLNFVNLHQWQHHLLLMLPFLLTCNWMCMIGSKWFFLDFNKLQLWRHNSNSDLIIDSKLHHFFCVSSNLQWYYMINQKGYRISKFNNELVRDHFDFYVLFSLSWTEKWNQRSTKRSRSKKSIKDPIIVKLLIFLFLDLLVSKVLQRLLTLWSKNKSVL